MGARRSSWSASGCWLLAFVGSLSACRPPPPECPEPIVAPAIAEATVAPPPAPPEKTRCWGNGKPQPLVLASEVPNTRCRPLTEAHLRRAEARIRKETPITFKPSRLYIDVICDPTTAALRELVYEDGEAATGTLRIVQVRELEGGDWSVRVIDSVHARDQRRVELKGGTIKALELRAAVDAARTSLHVRPNLVSLRTNQPAAGMDGSINARNYLRVTVEDVEGHTVDMKYLGPPSLGSQHQRLPISGAIAVIDEVLAKPKNKLAPVEETDEDRALYLRRLQLALALPSDEPWVKERYVNLATTFGTVDAIPLLTAVLPPPVNEKAPAGDDAVRESALDAIAVITGWNPRLADGKERSTADAAAVAIDECTAPAAAPVARTTLPSPSP